MDQDSSLRRRYPWAQFLTDRDTIVPHRVPFALARRFQLICNTVLAGLLAEQDVSVPLAYHAMALVEDFPGIDQRSLAALAGVDRTHVGQIVDDLEARGFIERKVSGADRRARELRATRRAVALRRRMRPKVLAAQAEILGALSPSERVQLVELLTRVVEANDAHARPGAGRRPPRRNGNGRQAAKPASRRGTGRSR